MTCAGYSLPSATTGSLTRYGLKISVTKRFCDDRLLDALFRLCVSICYLEFICKGDEAVIHIPEDMYWMGSCACNHQGNFASAHELHKVNQENSANVVLTMTRDCCACYACK